ncbi:type II secretion system GspH family protein [Actinoplanes sp. KI2]|uniref:type II secretion system protein n=1 Tax=Actinoplanes sp. KI2 TaxID=2983315 RepID=UPI0021D601C6|nr:type II secretion system GspH family protein [Actinoplanes sp. KI2]MCU7724387.1 type II secretion system GspH family protein [Actinoplanes sp. KI2]
MLRQRLQAARKNDEGFTLIELLIVVVVIGLLAGITIFGVDAFKNDGKHAVCVSDKKNVEIAIQAYYAKNNFKYPTAMNQLYPTYLKSQPSSTVTFTDADTAPVVADCPAA